MLKHFLLSFGVTVLCVFVASVAVFRIFIVSDNTLNLQVHKVLSDAEGLIKSFDEAALSNYDTPSYMYLLTVMSKNTPPYRYTDESYMLLLDDEYALEEYEYIEEPIAVQTPRRPSIALTFDDGPAGSTRRILNILANHNAHATFFVLGRNLERYYSTALRIFESGNELANHSFNHRRLILPMSQEQIIREIQSTSAAIEEITGEPAIPIFRPPYGIRDNNLSEISYELGYAMILWNLDPLDWLYRDACHIYYHIMRNARDGAIIVLHDIYHTTAIAMERVVPGLIQRGFDLVTVSELIYRNHGRPPMAGQIYSSGR